MSQVSKTVLGEEDGELQGVQEEEQECASEQRPSASFVVDTANAVTLAEDSVASKLSFLVNGIIQQTQTAMDNFLSAINEIDASSSDVIEDILQTRACALERKAKLDEDRDRFQQAACKVLDMLNTANSLMNVPNGDCSFGKEDSSQ